LFEQTGALAVDMETEIVRRHAQRAGLPMATVRAISDSADQELPVGMDRWIDAEGRVRLGVLSREILRRPGNLPALIRLGRQSRLATAILAEAIKNILRLEINPSPKAANPRQ